MITSFDFTQLSPRERIDLALQLWESVDPNERPIDASQELIDELVERSRRVRSGEDRLVDWPEVRASLSRS